MFFFRELWKETVNHPTVVRQFTSCISFLANIPLPVKVLCFMIAQCEDLIREATQRLGTPSLITT